MPRQVRLDAYPHCVRNLRPAPYNSSSYFGTMDTFVLFPGGDLRAGSRSPAIRLPTAAPGSLPPGILRDGHHVSRGRRVSTPVSRFPFLLQ